MLGAAAMALVAIGVAIGWTIGPPGGLGGSPSPTQSSPVALRSPSPRVATPTPVPRDPLLWPEGLFAGDRRDVRVDGVEFSFNVPSYGWEQYGSLYVSKSTVGPQGAEAMIFWARFPRGEFAQACPYVATSNVSTAAELASVLATDLDGPDLVSGPSEVTVGGLPAQKVVLFVRDFERRACGPGLFYTWDGEDQRRGAMWGDGVLGDTVTVWVVDVYGTLFVIGGQTHLNASAGLVQELDQIVDSISFTELGLGHDYLIGRHAVNVDGIQLSFGAPARGWAPMSVRAPLGGRGMTRSSGSSMSTERRSSSRARRDPPLVSTIRSRSSSTQSSSGIWLPALRVDHVRERLAAAALVRGGELSRMGRVAEREEIVATAIVRQPQQP